MKRRSKYLCQLLVLMLAALACNLPLVSQENSVQESANQENRSQLPDGLTENYVPAADTFLNPFNYSPDQQATRETLGDPTRFTIIFTSAGRQETWIYDTSGYSVIFKDGTKIAEKTDTPQYRAKMYATKLKPGQFYYGMGVDEVVLSTGRSDLMFATLEGLDKESRLMYLEGLSVGLVDGRVNFVETIPATTEILLSEEDFTPLNLPSPVSLTPEEAANEGTHTYAVTIMENDEILEEHTTTFTITFTEGGCQLKENDSIVFFTQTAPNQYQDDEEDPMLMTFNSDGFSWTFIDGPYKTSFVFQD